MFKKSQKGFTLIEALIVIVIIGIIAAVAIPKFANSKADSETKTCQGNLSIIQSAIAHYKFDNGSDPATVAALVTGGYLEVAPKCPSGGTYSITSGVIACSETGHTLGT